MSKILDLNDCADTLARCPVSRDLTLRAWDAADEYLLRHLATDPADLETGRLLVVNDAFGALAVGLGGRPLTWWNDSFLGHKALVENLSRNGIPEAGVTAIPADETPAGPFQTILMKIPKSIDLFEDMLLRIQPSLVTGSRVLAGGMIKHTPGRAYRLLEKIIGPTRTSLGWKKARLAFSEFEAGRNHPPCPAATEYQLPDLDLTLTSRPGVFARNDLDPGTRLLLSRLPVSNLPLHVADLGCGNGVLALAVARQCPAASVYGVDESHLAVASARENLERAGMAERNIRFEAGDGLEEMEAGSLDLVVCNPPFHQAQTVGDHLAWRMFEQSKRALKPGGELRIVGNRHLGYHVKLKRVFRNHELLASDRKFVVLSARR